MKSQIVAFVAFLHVLLVCTHAAPPSGRYYGFLKLTKHVDGLTATTTVRAVAMVGTSGELTIVLATAQSPLPDASWPSTTPSDVLRTTIAADNTCVIPSKPQPAKASSPEGPEGTVSVQIPVPIFRGAIRLNENSFSLSYRDIPANVSFFVAPTTFTEFSYFFRRTYQR